jgi:hypothetical protein
MKSIRYLETRLNTDHSKQRPQNMCVVTISEQHVIQRCHTKLVVAQAVNCLQSFCPGNNDVIVEETLVGRPTSTRWCEQPTAKGNERSTQQTPEDKNCGVVQANLV